MFAAFPLPLAAQTSLIPPRFNVTVGCCVVCPHDQPPPVNQLQLNMLMCCPLLLFVLIICSNAVPSTFCIRTQVDCYVIEVLLVQQQLHLPPCTSFVHKSAEVHRLVHSQLDHFNGSDGWNGRYWTIAGGRRRHRRHRMGLRVVLGRCGGCRTWFWWLRGLEMRPMSKKILTKQSSSRWPPFWHQY